MIIKRSLNSLNKVDPGLTVMTIFLLDMPPVVTHYSQANCNWRTIGPADRLVRFFGIPVSTTGNPKPTFKGIVNVFF